MSAVALKQIKRAKPARQASQPARPIRLEYINPNSKSVYVAGTFNDWHPGVLEMVQTRAGHWAKEVTLSPGRYEYRFLVDGVWTTDSHSIETAPNPYGEQNSVLHVGPAVPTPREKGLGKLSGTEHSSDILASRKEGQRLTGH